ncbi:hypothetical protein CROQUDRAFT_45399, partial [Cronartium quercuum f. sp. fusiforme G11]
AQRNAKQRKELQKEWAKLQDQLTAMYLLCQHQTQIWTTQAFYLTNTPPCKCSTPTIHKQSVDLINMQGHQIKRVVKDYTCMPQADKLISYGHFASVPNHPQTAFSILLIQFHHKVCNTTSISTTSFLNGLLSFLNTCTHVPLVPHTGSTTPQNHN